MDSELMSIAIGDEVYYEENEHAVQGRVTDFNRALGLIQVVPLDGIIKFKKWISNQSILSEDEIIWE
jgi:hypothetical protein